jgi:hypothetical protein
VRQWYLTEGAVALWHDYSNTDRPEELEVVLRQFAREYEGEAPWWADDQLWVLCENQGCCIWFIQLDDSDDPPVFQDPYYDQREEDAEIPPPEKVADRFSVFLFDWFAQFYRHKWTPLSERSSYPHLRKRSPRAKPYLDGLWLYAPDAEPLAPPYLDYLIDHFAEDSRQEIAAGVTQHHFHDDHIGLRVTTDHCREKGGASAWWLHADSDESLFQLARKVWWCCDLPEKLRGWSKVARPMMERLRTQEPG